MSDVVQAAEEFSEKIIDEGDAAADAEDAESENEGNAESNGNGKLTLEERRAKLAELRKRMVRAPMVYTAIIMICSVHLTAFSGTSKSCPSRRGECESQDHGARGGANRTPEEACRDIAS